MREGSSNDVNSGFFIIKNNHYLPNIVFFFKHICNIFLNTPQKNMPFGDQTIINNHKNIIEYDFIPNEYVIWGKNTLKPQSLLHHAVGCKDVKSKLEQIQEIQLKKNS